MAIALHGVAMIRKFVIGDERNSIEDVELPTMAIYLAIAASVFAFIGQKPYRVDYEIRVKDGSVT